jgi:hypothetical protein
LPHRFATPEADNGQGRGSKAAGFQAGPLDGSRQASAAAASGQALQVVLEKIRGQIGDLSTFAIAALKQLCIERVIQRDRDPFGPLQVLIEIGIWKR